MTLFYKAFIFFFTLPLVLYPQSQNIKFERISAEQGLSYEKVYSILQDCQGFMWFATDDGLNKYDSYKFTIYKHDPEDSLSLSSNWITSLYEDQSGLIWIGTKGGGLNQFDREKEKFIHYQHDHQNPLDITPTSIERISLFQYEGEKVLWMGTYNGLYKMDVTTIKFTHYPNTDKGYPYTNVEALAVDSIGTVWIGTTEGGLHKFNPETEQYTHYSFDPNNPNSLSNNRVMVLCIDRSGILWIGTAEGGLNKFDIENNKFKRFQHDPNNLSSLSSNYVLSIYEDRDGDLWIGTADGGLNLYDRETEQFTHYKNDPGDPTSLSDNTVLSIYEDKSGVLWIGTWGSLNINDPRKTQFFEYKKIPGNPNSLSNNFTTYVLESTYGGKKSLWIGTKNGLNKIDRKTGKYTHYLHDPNNAKSIPSNLISSLIEDRSSMLWIGTYGDGLIKFDRENEKFICYVYERENPNSITGNIILSIFEDKNGVIWTGTQTGGLNKFNRKTEQFHQLGPKMPVTQIYEDKSGVLWVASWTGLRKLDRETGKFITYLRNRESPNYIDLNRTNTILESRFGEMDILWTGTFGGLNKFNRKSGEFITYTTKDGLPNNVINGILEDKHGNLWLSTNGGVSKFDPKTNTFRNYGIDDGLPSIQFWPGGCFKSNDGELFFGSTKGMFAFYPDRLMDNPYIPEVVITDFQIFNKPVLVNKSDGDENDDVYSLPKHISVLEKIELSYRQSVLSFEFAVLDYHSPQKNKYAYKMEGVDPDWVFADASRRFASYTQLDPGEYVFRVKGSNNDGIWNEKGTSLKIIIKPPWWRTTWAYAVYILLFAFTLYALRTYDQKRQRLKHDLELEHLHAEKLEEVDHMKSRFFTNISHEFRTPLTLIKGPVKQIISGDFKGNLIEQCKMILRNSDRLLGLINQILDLSKLESGGMKLQVSETEVIRYLKRMVHSFASLAEQKKITLKFEAAEKSLYGYIDQEKIEKIITNLLSNAFKFTPADGAIVVAVQKLHPPQSPLDRGDESVSPLEYVEEPPVGGGDKRGCLQLAINNTGLGIPSAQLDKIFDRFYQTDNSYLKDSEGSGIGLSLTKELVEAHHGEITVTSMPNKSTTFKVILPFDKVNYKEDEIVETTEKDSPLKKGIRGLLEPIEDYTEIVERERISKLKKTAPLILIVEDNPEVITYIRSFLETDYQILSAENGKEGWRKTLDKYPALIISDIMMPEMDGFELCKKIKLDENTSHIPVILLTAKADLNSKIEGLEFGADDYISKPFDAEELQARVKNLINLRRKLRLRFQKDLKINPAEVTSNSMDEKFFEKICTIVEQHINDTHLTAEKLANECNVSHRSLNRKLNALTGYSARKFISTMRLKRAAQLLQNNTDTVSQIAYQVGFRNLSYFTQIFRHQFNTTPAQYRNHFQVSA